MGLTRRFFALPLSEKWLVWKTYWLLFGLRITLFVLGFVRTQRILAPFARRPVPRLVHQGWRARRVARLVRLTSYLVPDGRHCLTRALALRTLLVRRGHPAEVQYGVARETGGELVAHAWVTCEGEIMIGGDERARYTAFAAAYPEQGGTDDVQTQPERDQEART